MAITAPRDDNRVPALIGSSNAADRAPVDIYADPSTHRLLVNATLTGVSSGDGALLDGVDSNIRATILDKANSNPLTVAIVDGSGDQISSFGGGTQYTEDAAAAANPVGTAVNLIRKDTPASEVTTDGDNVAQRGTTYGAAYVTLLDTTGTAVSVGGGTQYDEDTASADGQKLTMAGVTRADTAASQVGTDGDRSTLIVDASGRMHVNVGASALPTGAATSAKQDTGNGSLSSIDGKITAVNTGAVVVSSSALPSGAATSAKQDTMITSLQLIDDVVFAEDAAHTTGDKGIPMLTVRNDAGGSLAGSDGDYHPLTTDATGALRVDLNGTISTNNSTTATLLAAATFTGTGEDALNYNEIRITVIASHASATDGLSIQQSSDNSNWDITDTYTVPASTGKTYSVPRQARYFRIVYTNGGTNQTSFRLQSILNRLGARVSSQRAGDAYTNETDLEQQQSFLMGYNGSTWDRIRTVGTGVLSASAVLTAGTAIIGKVGIDQTTPGTTNLVALAANQSVNVTQFNGTTAVNGSGTATGALRVELPTNGTGIVGLAAGTNGIGKLTANSGVDIGDVDVTTVGTITPGTAATSLGKAEDAVHSSGDVGVFGLHVGNEAQSTLAADGDYIGGSVDTKGNTLTVGNLAHDAVDAGFPVKVGGQARTTNPTAVADADRSNFITDKLGKQVVVGSIRDLKGEQVTTITSSTSETTIVTAVASTFLDVYGLVLTNSSASATKVTVRDATAGGTARVYYVPAGEMRGFMLPESAAVKQGTVNNNWTAQCGTSVASLDVQVLYVKNI